MPERIAYRNHTSIDAGDIGTARQSVFDSISALGHPKGCERVVWSHFYFCRFFEIIDLVASLRYVYSTYIKSPKSCVALE